MVLSAALTWIHIIMTVALIIAIMLQSGRSAGLGTIGGGAEGIFGKKKKGLDPLLMKATIITAVGYMGTALLMSLLKK